MDAQILQIIRFFRHSRKGPRRTDAGGAVSRKAPDVQQIDQGFVPGHMGPLLTEADLRQRKQAVDPAGSEAFIPDDPLHIRVDELFVSDPQPVGKALRLKPRQYVPL